MKNITKKILSALLVLAVLFVFASCNDESEQTTNTSSSESASSSEESTTTESKETTSSSETASSETETTKESTSSSETETTKPHEHVFGEWTVTKTATCTEDGSQERSCSCGEKETKSIKASGHVILTVNAKLPTCTEEGFTEKQTCSVCNEILKQSQTVPATGHGWGEGKITKEPTETETGIRIFTCGACGETKTESIPVLAHTHKYTATVTAPTCSEKGFTTYNCACGDNYTDNYVGAKGHAWNDGIVTKEPTETETGVKTFSCENCSETKTESIPVLAHTHKYTATVTAPTCTEKGFTTYNCACGDNYTDNYVNAKGHTESIVKGKDATCTESGLTNGKKCSACGEILLNQETIPSLGHTWNDGVITKEPTETETGIKTFTCGICSETKTESVPVLSHTHRYTATVTAPTCTEKGFTTHKCSCGDSYVDSHVDAKGHAMGAWKQTKAPSCTEKGEEKSTCANCTHFETKEIAAKGHTYTSVVTKPTCTEKGFTTHKCSCGDSYTDSFVSATGHTMGEWKQTKAPTCTAKGEEKSVCKSCTHFETRAIAPTGHSYNAVVTKPTCTEKGFTTHKCSCGDSYTDSFVSAIGHTWNNGVVTKEPTETETGIKTFTCKNCNETKTETLAVLPHTHKYTATVTAPTCTEQGYTTYTCPCGESYTGNEVKATGHKEKTEYGKASTCLNTGLTEKISCSVCQTVIKEASVIPKKDHNFNHLGCSVCGITFADDDGYNCLATFRNGIAMQNFYKELDRIAEEFHTSGKNLEVFDDIAMAGHIIESEYNLTLDEAFLVFDFYKNDHPNYFWIYPGYGTTSNEHFALIVPAEYASAAERAKHEQCIFDALNEYLALVKDEDSAYEMALAFHDKIITNTVYTTNPADMTAVWAHNILGVMEKGNGVCESYAKTFQLLLNCVGIENIYITGVSNGINHVWNLIQLDDGKWYWCDLTWDDDENNSLDLGWGISYNYFCVNDLQSVLHYYQDGGYFVDSNKDGKHDTANIHESHILDYSHHLPKRSDTVYDGSLRDTFTVDGLEFAISGYRTVQFVHTDKTGTVDIPETVEYNGVTYTVTSVGRIRNDGIFISGKVAPYASKINLPATIVYIWNQAI